MASPFKIPTFTALGAWGVPAAVGATFLIGGAAMPEDARHADWGRPMIWIGLLLLVIPTAWFVLAHIRYPKPLVRLGQLRLHYADTPNPNQWLLDMEAEQQTSFVQYLPVTRREIDLEPYGQNSITPFAEIRYFIANGSLYHISFDCIEKRSQVSLNRGILPNTPQLEESGGHPPPQTARVKMTLHFSPEEFESLKAEMRANGQITSLDFTSVRINVRAKPGQFPDYLYSGTLGLGSTLPFVPKP